MNRKTSLLARTAILGAAALWISAPDVASAWQTPQTPPATQPDNTKTNKRDRADSEKTADQAKENTSDRKLMQDIRKSIMADKALSTYAHNVKVIATHGKVTLKGPVRSSEEKQAIEEKATAVAGAGNVTNQLTVKADKDKS